MDTHFDLRALGSHLEQENRLTLPLSRTEIVACEAGGAWITRDPTGESEFPSKNLNRVHWLARDTPVRTSHIHEALQAMRSMGAQRFFAWLGPLAWDQQSHADLLACGGIPMPYVRYVVLTRAAGECEMRQTSLQARIVQRYEVEPLLTAILPWYNERGVAALRRLLPFDWFELHAAFDGPTPVAIAALVVDGAWAHLGWAGTDPAHQRRGAQTALICSRLRSARDRGAGHCAVEINTVVETSQNNLKRCGFKETVDLKVYGWQPEAT